MNTKVRLLTCLIWGLAAYCAYGVIMSLQSVAANWVGRGLPSSPEWWIRQLVFLAGVFIYPYMSSQSRRAKFIGDGSGMRLRLFQIFSGVLAGFHTFLLQLLFARQFFQYQFNFQGNLTLWALMNAIVILCVLAAGFMILRETWRNKTAWLWLSFAVTTVLLILQTVERHGVFRGVDPLILLAGGVFLVFAYFFPGAARAVVAGCAVLFAAVFGIVGSMFGGGRR